MNPLEQCQQFMHEDRNTQTFNGVPIFLNLAAWSGFQMKEEVGANYQQLLLRYAQGQGECSYWIKDYERLWQLVQDRLAQQPDFLQRLRNQQQGRKRAEKLFQHMEHLDLKTISDLDLIKLMKDVAQAQADSVGLGHILESVSWGVEREFRKALKKNISDQKSFNQVYAALSAPLRPSFLAQEEQELWMIKQLEENEREDRLKQHAKKWHWIQNTYAGAKELDAAWFKQHLPETEPKTVIIVDKTAVLKEYNLGPDVAQLAELIEFATDWQDQRKAFILEVIGYLYAVLEEVGRRAGVPASDMVYITRTDVDSAQTVQDIAVLKEELGKRTSGVYFHMVDGKEYVFSGAEYQKLYATQLALERDTSEIKELHGAIANRGTAVGKVVICKDLASISRVQEGDVLVASMTRPEFMPAIRKAVAIVTDEGGITCHAAIVARELNIPAVIGTRDATRVLQDGMVVEVRANHGLVKLVEAAHV